MPFHATSDESLKITTLQVPPLVPPLVLLLVMRRKAILGVAA